MCGVGYDSVCVGWGVIVYVWGVGCDSVCVCVWGGGGDSVCGGGM